MEIRAARIDGFLRDGVEVFIRQRNMDGVKEYARPITFSPAPEEAMSMPPAITLTMDAAQMLIDQLWTCGLRPTEGTGSAGSLAATQRHLEDMRAIVSARLNIALGVGK